MWGANGIYTFLDTSGIKPTNNPAKDEFFSAGLRALRQSVIQRKISHGVQSASGAVCHSRLLSVTTNVRQQGRDAWEIIERAWIANHRC